MVKQVEVFSDLSYTPKLDNFGDIGVVRNLDAIKQSIFTIINTKKGSRLFEPDFGCNLNYYLFEPFTSDTGMKIGKDIERNLSRYEPRITLNEVIVNMDQTNDLYTVNVIYTINELQTTDSFNISLQRL